MSERPNPLIFLSSTVWGLEDVRERIHDFGQTFGPNAVWVEEIIRPQPNRVRERDLANADGMLDELEASREYIGIVATDRSGTDLSIGNQDSHVSFFEMELFYAALLGRPITIVVLDAVVLAPRIVALLDLLEGTLPRACFVRAANLTEAEARIRQEVERVARGGRNIRPRTSRGTYARMLERVWTHRGDVHWLGDQFWGPHSAPNRAVIDECLGEAARRWSQRERLTRVWIAARELMAAPYWTASGREWLSEWKLVLSAWNKAGAWYGLHGHIELGYLAALNSIAAICEVGRQTEPSRADDPAWQTPSSSLASAYHALGRRVRSRRARKRALDRALMLINRSAAPDAIGKSNIAAIRGSILRARLNFGGAVASYEEVVALRSAGGAGPGEVGEAMSELGYGLLFVGQWRRGRETLEAGVRLMEDVNYSPGFLVRAKRKLARAMIVTGRWKQAEDVRRQADQLAVAARVGQVGAPASWL